MNIPQQFLNRLKTNTQARSKDFTKAYVRVVHNREILETVLELSLEASYEEC